jgi:hypothetical protein
MKALSIKYVFDKAAGVYIIPKSQVIGINLWDGDLDRLIDRVAQSAPTYIELNHPELHGVEAIDLSFENNNGGTRPIVRNISLKPRAQI